jgi:hypothetical protein
MGKILLIGALLAFLAVTIWFAVAGWNLHGDVPISGHGYAAMTIGIVLSVLVGVGLMTLVFYSSRKGYDEPAQRERRNVE